MTNVSVISTTVTTIGPAFATAGEEAPYLGVGEGDLARIRVARKRRTEARGRKIVRVRIVEVEPEQEAVRGFVEPGQRCAGRLGGIPVESRSLRDLVARHG